MKSGHFLFLCCAGFCLGTLTGCVTAKTDSVSFAPVTPHNATNLVTTTLQNPLSPELLQPGSTPFTLGPGDVVDLEIVGTPTSRLTTHVGPDGKIYYNLLPGLDVWGLTLTQARESLEKEMGKYLTTPKININLRSVGSKYVWLLGRLNRPGIYATAGGMTLLEAIAQAGGTAHSSSEASSVELADLRHSFIVRQGKFLPVDFYKLLRQGVLSKNIVLQADVFVFIR